MKFKAFSLKFSILLQFDEVLIIVRAKETIFFLLNWLKKWNVYVLKVRRVATSSAGESSGLGHIGITGHRAQFCCGLWLDRRWTTKLTEIVWCDDKKGQKFRFSQSETERKRTRNAERKWEGKDAFLYLYLYPVKEDV